MKFTIFLSLVVIFLGFFTVLSKKNEKETRANLLRHGKKRSEAKCGDFNVGCANNKNVCCGRKKLSCKKYGKSEWRCLY